MQTTQHFIANLTTQELQSMALNWKINNELANINDWLKINKLALNIKKYKIYDLNKKHILNQKKLELKIDNINIEYVKFLQLF